MSSVCYSCKHDSVDDAVNGDINGWSCPKCGVRNLYDFDMSLLGSENNGGSTDYYKLPDGAKDLQDLIEFKQMNFAQGNIFKAIYRHGAEHHSSYERDLNKILYFVDREIKRIKNEKKS